MNSLNKRTFLNLDFVQGEEIELEFEVLDNCEQVYLDEYTLTGSIKEDFNSTPVTQFVFTESEEDPVYWIASIPSAVTTSLIPQVYKYEIRMQHNINGKPDTLLYGTLTIRPTRI